MPFSSHCYSSAPMYGWKSERFPFSSFSLHSVLINMLCVRGQRRESILKILCCCTWRYYSYIILCLSYEKNIKQCIWRVIKIALDLIQCRFLFKFQITFLMHSFHSSYITSVKPGFLPYWMKMTPTSRIQKKENETLWMIQPVQWLLPLWCWKYFILKLLLL